MKFLRLFLLVTILLLSGTALAAHRAEVVFEGQALFQVGSTEALDASERAQLISHRLRLLLESGQENVPVKINATNFGWEISAGDVSLLTVTDRDGSEFQTPPELLARQWARAIEGALQAAREQRKEPIKIDGIAVFSVGSTEAAQASERAAIINNRLREIVEKSSSDPTVRVEKRENLQVITVGDQVLLTVTESDALSSGMNREELANHWARLLDERIKLARQQRTREYMLFALWRALLALALLALGLFFLFRLRNSLLAKLAAAREQSHEPGRVELGWSVALENLTRWGAKLSGLTLTALFLYYVLGLTPQTRRYLDSFLSTTHRTLDKIAAGFEAKLFSLGGENVSLSDLVKVLVFILFIFWFARFVRRLLNEKIFSRTHIDRGAQHAISTVTSYLIIAIGLIVGLRLVGVSLSSIAVILGAVSIGIGFGLQNIANNFLSGLIILFERPIQVGDRVEIGNVVGDVVRISVRSTTILTNDNIAVIVPNSNFISSTVINWSHHGDRRIRFHITVPVAYNSDVKLAQKAMLEAAAEHPDVLKYPEPNVRFMEFGSSALIFELRVWTVSLIERPGKITSDLNFAIYDKFKKYGIEIPFPQHDIHLRSAIPIQAHIEQVERLVVDNEAANKKFAQVELDDREKER